MRARSGVILLVVTGICGLLVALSLAILVRNRIDAREQAYLMDYTQARLMLNAACCYILETGRLGYDGVSLGGPAGVQREVFGWVDVRDGSLGPKHHLSDAPDYAFTPMTPGSFPRIGGKAARFPMEVLVQPPWAIRGDAAPNPIESRLVDPSNPVSNPVDAVRYGLPSFPIPDPVPIGMDPIALGWTPLSGDDASRFPGATGPADKWRQGDDRLRPLGSTGAWFRLYRDGPATFVATCGSGGTYGYRPEEVDAAVLAAHFSGDRRRYESLAAEEVRLWYRVEWSPAIGRFANARDNDGFKKYESGVWYSGSEDNYQLGSSVRVSGTNALGTIQWVQRLREPPRDW